MKPIGKSFGGFYIYPVTSKRYQCNRCGFIMAQSTNHFQPTWSSGHMNVCPKCPPWAKYPEFGGSTTWTCLDKPEEEDVTEEPGEQSFAEALRREADALLVSPMDEGRWRNLAIAGLTGAALLKNPHFPKQAYDKVQGTINKAMAPRPAFHFDDPNKVLPSEEKLSAWEYIDKKAKQRDEVARLAAPFTKRYLPPVTGRGTNTVTQEADERLPMTTESDTLVIHMEDPSTDFLKVIYQGKGYNVINGMITSEKLMDEIEKHQRIFMLGHGSPSGLFGPGFMVGREFGSLLRQKTGIYIWCHAVEYAHEHRLSGLVSGMFISEVREADYMGIKATQAEVDASNYAFSRAVRQFIDTGSSPHEVRNCYTNAACKVTQYNNERLYVMENGRVVDTLGKPQPDEVSAKPGSPRYRNPERERRGLRGPYGELDEPPESFRDLYGWDDTPDLREADELLPRRPEFKVDDLLDLTTRSRKNLDHLRRHPVLQNKPEIMAHIDDLTGKMGHRDELLHRLKFALRLKRELAFKNATADQVESVIPSRGTPNGVRPLFVDGVVLKGGKKIMFTKPLRYPPQASKMPPPKAAHGMPPPPPTRVPLPPKAAEMQVSWT